MCQAKILPNVKPFYKHNSNLLSHYHQKNVVYIAYVGKHYGKYTFKYGKSTDIYQREMGSHRQNFNRFDMLYIYKTNLKDQVETMFEKELMIRGWHASLVLEDTAKPTRQTELFQLRRKKDVVEASDILLEVISQMEKTYAFNTMVDHMDALKLEEAKLKRAKYELEKTRLEYCIKRMEYFMKLQN